jgi:hypothetical protein
MRLGFFVIFILTISTLGRLRLDAQASRQVFIITGLSLGAERDYGYSPLPYQGAGFTAALAYSHEKANKSDLLMLSFGQSALSNQFGNAMQVTTGSIQTYTFYHRDKGGTQGLHWGWSNHNEFNTRLHGSFDNFNSRSDYFTSFGPALRQRWPFQLGKAKLCLESLAHAQLIGFTVRSSYVSSVPAGFESGQYKGFNAILNSLEWFYPGKAWSAGLWPSLHLELKSGNRLGFSYRYDYVRLSGAHLVEKSRGQWLVSLIAGL